MEISIERSPQHLCPSEGTNLESFDHDLIVTLLTQIMLHNDFMLLMLLLAPLFNLYILEGLYLT